MGRPCHLDAFPSMCGIIKVEVGLVVDFSQSR